MFSVSPAEILTIAVVALLVFGPRRLPEIAKKAGKVVRDLRTAAEAFKSDIEREYGDTLAPLEEARNEMRATLGDVERATRPPLVPPPPRPEPPPGAPVAPRDQATPQDQANDATAPADPEADLP